MECKKCGKIIDRRKELKFCAGCGAEIVKEKAAPKKGARERAPDKTQIVSGSVVEIDTRTRAFYVAAFATFIFFYIALQIKYPSVFFSFIAALPCGAIGGLLGVVVVSRVDANLKSAINDGLGFIPAGGPVRRLVESLSSSLPLLGGARPASKRDKEKKDKKK
jgi:uncharacterized membrane protein